MGESTLLAVIALVSLAAAQDTSWMLTTDECDGFRQSPHSSAVRYAVSASTTWGGIGSTYDCPAGYTRAESRHIAIFDSTDSDIYHHTLSRNLVYNNRCGWTNYVWEGGSRVYMRFKGGTFYKHTGYKDYHSAHSNPTTSSFAGVVCHLDPANFPSWMLSTDNCYGFRGSETVPGINYAISNSASYDPNFAYTCPSGYRWISSDEWSTIRSTLGGGSSAQFLRYHGRCGWSGYSWAGQNRHYFRFNDTSVNGRYIHAGSWEWSSYSTGLSTGAHGLFAGLVCVYDEELDPFIIDDKCTNGTYNDPQVALAPPTLNSPTIANNNYVLSVEADRRFHDVKVTFGNDETNPCSYREEGSSGSWQRDTGVADPICGEKITLTKNYQTMIAATGTGACQFVRSTSGDDVIFRQDVTITTNQSRSIEYQQGFRNSTYYEVRNAHYVIQITVPTKVTVNSAAVNVTGNITVLRAITNLAVAVNSDPYKVGFTLRTSSQAPYQLTYASFTTTAALGTSITRASDTPACADPSFNTECLQDFVFSDLTVATPCPTKSTLNDAMSITFNVGCKASFGGNCVTPSPAQIVVSFTLLSTQFCPRAEDVSISATLLTYKGVSLTDQTDWASSDQSTSFVLGATVFGQVEVTVGQNAATLDTTKIRTLSTLTAYNNVPTVVYSSPSGVAGTVVEHGDTAQGGSVNWPSDNKQARFSVLLANPTTVALDPVVDAAQTVTLTAVVDVTYTTTSGKAPASPVLQEWHMKHHGEVRTQAVTAALGEASTTVGVGGSTSTAPAAPSSSSSSVAGMSTTTVVAVGAALVLLVVAAAYRVGQRGTISPEELKAQEESTLSLSNIRSSSAVDVVASATDDSTTASHSVSLEEETV